MELYNLVSFFGMFVLMGIAWLFSTQRKTINWSLIGFGVAFQLLFALFMFTVPGGTTVFLWINDLVVKVLDSASAGTRFLFGRLALPPGTTNEAGESSLGFFLAFQALPTIIFFSALMSILYYWNIMPRIIRGFAYVFTRFMRISGAESLAAASNIFVGIESALTIRPYLQNMTRSELCTILTAGMATVASNVLAIYVFSLQSQFPTIAGHLISASILSAPAALIMSKLVLPETETPETLGEHVQVHYEKEPSLFDAIMNGANTGVKLIVGIAALLIAILGLVALLDLVLGGLGGKINALLGLHIDWTLKGLLGYVGLPFALIMGVPPADALEIGRLIGERVVLTEVVSYQDLAVMLQQGVLQHPRSAVIATYALCGFAHVSSMAIFVGGVAALVPARSHVLGQVALRALFAATLATFMTACVAGTFYSSGMLPMGQ